MSWWVIVNPSAGRGNEIRERAAAALAANDIDYQLHESSDPDDVSRLVAEGVAAEATHFVSVGGDGTAHLVVNALMEHDWEEPPTLAILPAGSGSDFIRTFALPKRMEDAAEHLGSSDRYRCDLGVLEGEFGRRYFLNAANVGVAAASASMAQRLPRWLGSLRYTAGFWLSLAGFKTAAVEITAGRHSFSGEVINVVMANGQFFGGGLNVAPRAGVGDGLLDVQMFRGPRRLAFAVMPRVITGSHLTHHAVQRWSVPTVEVSGPSSWPVEADGEPIGSGSVRVSVLPGALWFKI